MFWLKEQNINKGFIKWKFFLVKKCILEQIWMICFSKVSNLHSLWLITGVKEVDDEENGDLEAGDEVTRDVETGRAEPWFLGIDSGAGIWGWEAGGDAEPCLSEAADAENWASSVKQNLFFEETDIDESCDEMAEHCGVLAGGEPCDLETGLDK